MYPLNFLLKGYQIPYQQDICMRTMSSFQYKKHIVVVVLGLLMVSLRTYFTPCVCTSAARLDGKVIIVTGSNTGIGKYTVQDFVNRGGKVYMACRSLDKATAAAEDILRETGASKDKVQVMKLDLASLASVREFAKEFMKRESMLHVLVNNAGVFALPHRTLSPDGYEMHLATNHLGHFLLTHLLLDPILASAGRVLTVTSSYHGLASPGDLLSDPQLEEPGSYGMLRPYAQSKLANVMFSRELGKRLNGTGVVTAAVEPGIVPDADIVRHVPLLNNRVTRMLTAALPGFKTLVQGAQTSVCCAVDDGLVAETGLYYCDCAVAAPHPGVAAAAGGERLWTLSEKLVGLAAEETVGAALLRNRAPCGRL